MKRFIATLSDDEHAALDRIRAAMGLRSKAEAVRALIAKHDLRGAPIVARLPTAFIEQVAKDRADAGEPFKTRLKGEWSPAKGKAKSK